MTSLVRVSLAATVLAILALGGWLALRDDAAEVAPAGSGIAATVTIGGPFTLVDHRGAAVTDADFRGRHLLVYFGYTFCPDVCPTELGRIAVALDELGDDGARVTPIMISIDPERDTPTVLADYVTLFHERLVGLTGSRAQIEAVAKAYRVFYRRVEEPAYTHYLMDHSSFTYLMDPDGKLVTMFRYGTAPATMADTIRRALATS